MSSPQTSETLPIIDSHIHLYAASHIAALNWTTDLDKDHRLNRPNSVDQYKAATQGNARVRGFVFLETDRRSGLEDNQWTDALDEVDFLVRIARGTPVEGEGHSPEDSRLVLGIVPWAPVPTGERGLADYVHQVKQHTGSKWDLIKGFRYLVQDKPAGVMLQPKFVEGLQWLGDHGHSFDLGVDARSGGMHQLEEACEMMDRLYDGESHLRIVVNHLCKPNLRLSAQEALDSHPDFTRWKTCVERMAGHPHTYMKLSGLFSELPQQDETSPTDISVLVEHTKPWIDVVFSAFGPARVMFGSDWPVCNAGGPGVTQSWSHWHDLVTAILSSQNLSLAEQARVWAGTAAEAYNIAATD